MKNKFPIVFMFVAGLFLTSVGGSAMEFAPLLTWALVGLGGGLAGCALGCALEYKK